jgi:hypothetical protein
MAIIPGVYTYDFEVENMMTVFMRALSDIVVKRFNENKQAEDQIQTRLVYAPKQRVLADLLDKDQNLQLPVVACYIGGITRDTNRVFNKLLGTYNSSGPGTVRNDQSPQPIDVAINVTIATRFQKDMDQILSHIIPYVNPYFVVSWRTPARPDFEIRSSVFWNGNANISYPYDIASTQVAKVVADLSFTFKGWMFQAAPSTDTATIYTIHTDFNPQFSGIPPEFLLEPQYQVDTETRDYRQINGVPPQPSIIEPHTSVTGVFQQFNIYGEGFTRVTNVYVSGAPVEVYSTLQNPFSGFVSLSADYPSFFGAKVDSTRWSSNGDNLVTFVMPSATVPGRVDVIVEGPVGYGTLTQNVRINTFNPYLSTDPHFSSYVPYQMPYLSGIQIFHNNQD